MGKERWSDAAKPLRRQRDRIAQQEVNTTSGIELGVRQDWQRPQLKQGCRPGGSGLRPGMPRMRCWPGIFETESCSRKTRRAHCYSDLTSLGKSGGVKLNLLEVPDLNPDLQVLQRLTQGLTINQVNCWTLASSK